MKPSKFIIATVGVLGILVASNMDALAGDAGGSAGLCHRDHQPSGAVTRTGIAGIEVFNFTGFSGDVDVTIQLNHNGKNYFYRKYIAGVPMATPAELVCSVLSSDPAALGTQILTDPNQEFRNPGTKAFFITDRSLKETDFLKEIILGGVHTGRFTGVTEITLYIADANSP
jgi:hypothetical protein